MAPCRGPVNCAVTVTQAVIRSQNERLQVPAELASEQGSRRKERRWWKGIGQIVQGAAMSLADGALAVGALKFEVSDETKTWGALVIVNRQKT